MVASVREERKQFRKPTAGKSRTFAPAGVPACPRSGPRRGLRADGVQAWLEDAQRQSADPEIVRGAKALLGKLEQ